MSYQPPTPSGEWNAPIPPPKQPNRLVAFVKAHKAGTAIVILALALIGALSSHSSGTKTHTSSSATKVAVTSPSTEAPSSTTAHDTLNSTATTRQWAAALQTLEGDAQDISTAAGSRDVSGMSDACATFGRDVTSAQALPDLPKSETMTHLRTALSLYQQASSDCVSGADGYDAATLQRAVTELNEGNAEIQLATSAL